MVTTNHTYFLIVKQCSNSFSGLKSAVVKEKRYTCLETAIDERNRLMELRKERLHILEVTSQIIL